MIPAGDLDRRVTLRRAVDFDGDVEAERVWVPLATVWAQHLPLRDAERTAAAATGALVTDRFRIRWAPEVADLSAADQLEFEGAVYQVAAVKPLGRREDLEITATAASDGGPA